jgi:hypothetical protein
MLALTDSALAHLVIAAARSAASRFGQYEDRTPTHGHAIASQRK